MSVEYVSNQYPRKTAAMMMFDHCLAIGTGSPGLFCSGYELYKATNLNPYKMSRAYLVSYII